MTAADRVRSVEICSTHDSQSGPFVHYCITRRDLSPGLRAANLVHAAGESSDRVPPGTIAVALTVEDETALAGLSKQLESLGIPHHCVFESTKELMAIGVEPTTDRGRVRRVVSALPLVR